MGIRDRLELRRIRREQDTYGGDLIRRCIRDGGLLAPVSRTLIDQDDDWEIRFVKSPVDPYLVDVETRQTAPSVERILHDHGFAEVIDHDDAIHAAMHLAWIHSRLVTYGDIEARDFMRELWAIAETLYGREITLIDRILELRPDAPTTGRIVAAKRTERVG